MSSYAGSIATPPRTLTEVERRRLLKTTGEHKAGFRDHILFAMALGTGLREHELLALDIRDVYGDGTKPKRRLTLRVFKRSTDKPATQEVVLPDALRTKLDRFYRWKQSCGEDVGLDAPLFISRRKKRLSARQLREVFHVWQERSGFERRLGFHALRHTACTNLYRQTKDLRVTQRFARHKSVVTTSIYAHPSDEDMVRAVLELPC